MNFNVNRAFLLADGKYWNRVPAYVKIVKILLDVLDRFNQGNSTISSSKLTKNEDIDLTDLYKLQDLSIDETTEDNLAVICSDDEMNAVQDEEECRKRNRVIRNRLTALRHTLQSEEEEQDEEEVESQTSSTDTAVIGDINNWGERSAKQFDLIMNNFTISKNASDDQSDGIFKQIADSLCKIAKHSSTEISVNLFQHLNQHESDLLNSVIS